MALGYIAAFSETLALSVVAEKALPPLVGALNEEPEDHLKSATAWTLGQVGTCAVEQGLSSARPPPWSYRERGCSC